MDHAQTFIKLSTFCSILFGVLFFIILFMVSPDAGNLVKIVFLFIIFFFVWSLTSLIAFYLKKKISNNEILYSGVKHSVRQGLFAGLFVLGLLSLAAIRILTIWDISLLAFSFILLEMYFKSSKVAR